MMRWRRPSVNSPACTIIRALHGSEEEPRALNDTADEEGGRVNSCNPAK